MAEYPSNFIFDGDNSPIELNGRRGILVGHAEFTTYIRVPKKGKYENRTDRSLLIDLGESGIVQVSVDSPLVRKL